MQLHSADPWVGKQVGRFTILERLAVGGMSIVYRVYDLQRQADVALKVIHESYVQNHTIVARFEQEAELVLSLKHPNLVEVYETGVLDGRLYILLQLVNGGSLTQILEAEPSIRLSMALKIIEQTGSVLDYIHSRRVIHRDIKLGNILIDKEGTAFLIDFGIARWLDGTDLTESGFQMPGTARYMPPEQVVGGMTFDHRADLYSLGVVTYFLTTGYFPFTGVNDLVLMNQHLTMHPRPPSDVNPALPAALDSVLSTALAKRIENRFNSAADFMTALKTALSGTADFMVSLQAFGENPARLMPEYDPTQRSTAYYPLPAPAPEKRDNL
jgi:serine/threonine-protein kinase